MLFVSEPASLKIKTLMAEQNMPENSFVRISVKGGGCSGLSYDMSFDHEQKPEDQVFEDKGVKLGNRFKSFMCATSDIGVFRWLEW